MSSLINMVMLEAEVSTAQGTTAGAWVTMIMYVMVIGVFFYFVMYKPQKKQQKAHELMVSEIKAGDSILTTSGFYGVVIDVMEEIVIVEFGSNKNCRIPMKKDAIVEVEKEESDK